MTLSRPLKQAFEFDVVEGDPAFISVPAFPSAQRIAPHTRRQEMADLNAVSEMDRASTVGETLARDGIALTSETALREACLEIASTLYFEGDETAVSVAAKLVHEAHAMGDARWAFFRREAAKIFPCRSYADALLDAKRRTDFILSGAV